MIYRLYSIKDIVAEEFGPIFGSKNDQAAYRSSALMLEKQGDYKADFELNFLGLSFDTATGEFTPAGEVVKPERVKLIDIDGLEKEEK